MLIQHISAISSKNYGAKTSLRHQKTEPDRSMVSFGSYDSFEPHKVINDCLNSIAQESRVDLAIDKTLLRHAIKGSLQEKPFTLKVNNNIFQGEQNDGTYDLKINTAYGGHAKSYEGNLNGQNIFIKSTNPWGSSDLTGSFDNMPADLKVKVRADHSEISGNLGSIPVDLKIITFMHKHKIEGKINEKKIDLTLNRNNICGEYQDSDNLLPLLYALYNDRLLKDIKL